MLRSLRKTLYVTVGCCLFARLVHAQPMSTVRDTVARADLRWALMSSAGRRTTLEAFRGRVIVVNSWATWCEPCVAEMQSLTALREAMPDSGLVFVLVAPQKLPAVQAFIARRGLRLPVYVEMSPAPSVYRFAAVPTTWIIDRAGRIVERRRGAANWNTDDVRVRLRALLATSAPKQP